MENSYLLEAVRCGQEGMSHNCGGPFGAVIVRGGRIIGAGYNRVLCDNDPTAHAEMVAIRRACAAEKSFWLKGAEIYTVCEPCPMCLAAIYWAHIDKVYFSNTQQDASNIGFDDGFLYQEFALEMGKRRIAAEQVSSPEAEALFRQWVEKSDKTQY